MRDTEGTIGHHQNKTYNSYQSRSSINPKTKEIYSKHHKMATHHWIIICGIKHHVQVGITAGCRRVDRVKEMRMVMLMKMITAAMIPLSMALRCHQERGGEVLPLVFPPPWPPLDGERFPLWSLAFMVMMAPPGSSSMPSGDDGPLRQGARKGLDWFSVAAEASGGGTPDLG